MVGHITEEAANRREDKWTGFTGTERTIVFNVTGVFGPIEYIVFYCDSLEMNLAQG